MRHKAPALTTSLLAAISTSLWVDQARAQNCESVIQLSRVVSTVVSDSATVEQHASSFCNEYASARSSGKSLQVGASYKFLAGSFGSSSVSAEEIASKYCSSSDSRKSANDAYKQYIESIAPGAYSAYEACLRMSRQELVLSVDIGALLPKEFTLRASFTPTSNGTPAAEVEASGSADVSCVWEGGKSIIRLAGGTTRTLKCRRPDQKKPSYVTVVRRNGQESLTLSWRPYDEQGLPVAVERSVSALAARVVELEARVEGLRSEAGRINLIAGPGSRDLLDETCPNSGFKGVQDGRITFQNPFPKPPVVSMGLVTFDSGISPGGPRITMEVLKVDETGFNYRFQSWCNTKVWSAAANWHATAQAP